MTSLQEILAALDRGVTVQVMPGSRAHEALKAAATVVETGGAMFANQDDDTLWDEHLEAVLALLPRGDDNA